MAGGGVRKILYPIVGAMLGLGPTVGSAAGATAVLDHFGLIGTWASDCAVAVTASRPGFRIIFADPPGSAPTYTTISSDSGVRMTIHSAVIGSVSVDGMRLKLLLRITGGDRDGGPLPSPTTNTFEQTIEMVAGDRIRLLGAAPQLLERCRD